jgi:signal transduction histidine kinase
MTSTHEALSTTSPSRGPVPDRVRGAFSGLWSRVLALVLVVMVPVFVLVVVLALQERNRAVEDAGRRALELTDGGARSIEELFVETELLLRTVSRLSLLDGQSCGAELVAGTAPASPHLAVYVAAPNGVVECVPDDAPDVAGERWFVDAVQRGGFTVTTPATDPVSGRPVVVASLPVVGPDGALAGVVSASVETSALLRFVHGRTIPESSAVAVVDADGRVIDRVPDGDRYRGQVAPFLPRLGDTGEVVESEGVDGLTRLGGATRVEVGGTTLLVAAGLSESVAHAGPDAHLAWSIAVTSLVGLTAGAVALALARATVVAPLQRVGAAMRALAGGQVDARVGALRGPTEIAVLGETFDAMADELAERLERLQDLVAQVDETAERERRRIAAGIHDQSLQTLAALSIQLQLLRRRTAADPDRQLLTAALEQADATGGELRNLLFDLNPPALERLGLGPALREILEVKLGPTGPAFRVDDHTQGEAPTWAETLLYRIAQEAIANVAAHADATEVVVEVAVDGARATMTLHDDGRGFDPAAVEEAPTAGHIGLRVMRDRARAAGGDVVVVSTPGGGTTVSAWLPVRRPSVRRAAAPTGPTGPT